MKQKSASELWRGRLPLRFTALGAVLLLAPPAFSQDTPSNLLKGLLGNLPGQQQVAPQTPDAVKELLRQNDTKAAQAAQVDKANGAPMSTDLNRLFAKGTVNGAELIGTLKAIKEEMRQRKAAKAALQLSGALDSAVNQLSSGSMDISSVLKDSAINAAISLVKQNVASAASKALDEHLQTVLDDSTALAAESITLPSPAGMTGVQAKRVVTMAALVVGARVTGKMLERTQKDMDGLKADYGKIINKREQAAKLLFAAISERNKALAAGEGDAEKSATLRASLSADDLSFLDKDLGSLKLADFSKDMAAQNLAIGYLQKVQPEAYASYRVETDDVVQRSKSYLRTMTGIVAFGAMSANFVQSVSEVAKDKQFGAILQSMPMMLDFLTAAMPLAKTAVETAAKGVELGASGDAEGGNFFTRLIKTKRSFIFVEGDKPRDMASAKEVFAAMNKLESAALFKGALFRSDAPGMLQRIGECDRAEAGRMLDLAVTKTEREEFATAYFNDADMADGFTFVNAMETPGGSAQEQLLPAQLLASDHRERTSSDAAPLSRVQLRVSEKYGEWGDNQLMRLIFANKEGQARHATLYVGDLKIRPVPSPEAVFVYETAADACKKLITKIAPPPPPPKAAAPVPTPDPKKDTKPAKGKQAPKKEGGK